MRPTAGQQQLAFNSSNAAFSVTSGDATASALMGSFNAGATGNGAGAITEVASGSTELATASERRSQYSGAVDLSPRITGHKQVSINAVDASGNQHSLTVNLNSGNAAPSPAALTTINQALQKSDDSTLQQITAVQTGSSTSSTLNFVSTLSNFTVNVGADSVANTEGLRYRCCGHRTNLHGASGGNRQHRRYQHRRGPPAPYPPSRSRRRQALGTAQAAVGNGEDQLNYAINLATSQITNFSAAESQIRDADIAQQAANLTKAQTLQQASIAAMAQANSAPQAILSLLKG
jgi:flagellin